MSAHRKTWTLFVKHNEAKEIYVSTALPNFPRLDHQLSCRSPGENALRKGERTAVAPYPGIANTSVSFRIESGAT